MPSLQSLPVTGGSAAGAAFLGNTKDHVEALWKCVPLIAMGIDGTASAYTATVAPAPASLVSGMGLYFVPHLDCAAGATLQVNLGASVPIYRHNGAAIAAGELGAGEEFLLVYRSAASPLPDRWVVMTLPKLGGLLAADRATGIVSFGDPDTGFASPSANALQAFTGGVGRWLTDAVGRMLMGYDTSVTTGSGAAHLQRHGNSLSMASIMSVLWLASTGAATIGWARSRGGAIGTRGAVLDGDSIGLADWMGDDGAAFVVGARLMAIVSGTVSSGVVPMRLSARTMGAGGTLTEWLGVEADGRITHRTAATTIVDENSNHRHRNYTIGTLPTASTCARSTAYVSNGAGNKLLVISDGTVWRYMDGTTV